MIVLGVLKCCLVFHKGKWQAGLHIREASRQTKVSVPHGRNILEGSSRVQDHPVLLDNQVCEPHPFPLPHCGDTREGTVPGTHHPHTSHVFLFLS